MIYFYNETIKKYLTAFIHVFSDISVKRVDSNGVVIESITVPVVLASKKKMFYEVRSLPTDEDSAIVSTFLPRVGIVLSGMTYDSTRKFNNTLEITGTTSLMRFPGVPYNFTFDFSVLSKNQDDMFQIIEQVCTKFTPDKTLAIKEIPFLESRDVSINLDGISFTSVNDFDDLGERVVSCDFSFTMKGYLYSEVKVDDDNIIKLITSQYNFDDESNDYTVTVSQSQQNSGDPITTTISEAL